MDLQAQEDIWCVDSIFDDRPPDIVIHVGSCYFHLHKDILIEHCDYFKAMFSSQMMENCQDFINVKLIEKHPFKILLQGFYSGHLQLTEENIFEVILAAHIIQVSDTLFQQCCDFMKSQINPKKCFEVMHFTKFHNLQEVYDASRRYCLIHFDILCKEESFLNMTLNQVMSYLSDEFLIAEGDYEKLQALSAWCHVNRFSETKILQEVVGKILHKINNSQLCEKIAERLSNQEKLDNHIVSLLGSTPLHQDLMMFWASLSDSKYLHDGLKDVVLLKMDGCNDDMTGKRVDTMTEIVQKAGFDLGSAVCCKGPFVYICGGGPNFGRMDWIRDVWRYSVLEEDHRWKAVGKLEHPYRYHTMIPVGTKLYIFGGFGKFRSKNFKLDSFDVITGEWSQHTNVPTWEVKPVATFHQKIIYYVSRECQMKIYAYNTILDGWTVLEAESDISTTKESEYFCPDETESNKPLSCFIFPIKEDSSCVKLVVLSQGTHFLTHSFKINMNSKCFNSLGPEQKHDIDVSSFKYIGSCVHENRIIVLFKEVHTKDTTGSDMESDDEQMNEICTPIHMMYFSHETGELKARKQINNIVNTQSFIAVPRVPKAFNIASDILSDLTNEIEAV